jgi:hypothetical protein
MTFLPGSGNGTPAEEKGRPMEITLPPDIERVLTAEASKRGTTPELLALDTLRERFLAEPGPAAAVAGDGTLAEFLAAHIGVLHSSEQVPGGARMSEDSGRQFAAGLLQKRQQGHL